MDCHPFRTQSKYIDYFGLDKLVDARPKGYRINFQFSVFVSKTAGIILSSADKKAKASFYEIRMIDSVTEIVQSTSFGANFGLQNSVPETI